MSNKYVILYLPVRGETNYMADTIGDLIDKLTISNVRLWMLEDERRVFCNTGTSKTEEPGAAESTRLQPKTVPALRRSMYSLTAISAHGEHFPAESVEEEHTA